MTVVVPGVYQLPIHVWVSVEVLGTVTPTVIGGIPAEVLTAVPTGLSDGTRPPMLRGVPADSFVRVDRPWTVHYAAIPTEPATALLQLGLHLNEPSAEFLKAVPHTDGTPEHAIATAVGTSIESWFDCLSSWVEVLTGQDLDHRHPVYDAASIAMMPNATA